MAAIVVKVLALATVANAWLDTSNNKIIHVVGLAGTAVTVTVATTLGSNPPAWTIAASFRASDLIGFALLSQRLEGVLPDNDNVAVYPINSLVNVLRKGRIWVNFETTFNPEKDTLYVRYTADTGKYIGDFLNSADSSKAVSLSGLPIRVLTKMTAAGIGLIEVNLP
jgi:hypothetical protein